MQGFSFSYYSLILEAFQFLRWLRVGRQCCVGFKWEFRGPGSALEILGFGGEDFTVEHGPFCLCILQLSRLCLIFYFIILKTDLSSHRKN